VIEKGISARINLVRIEVENGEDSLGLLAGSLEAVVVNESKVSSEDKYGEVEYLLLFLTLFHS